MDIDYHTKDSKIREILEILKPPGQRNLRPSYQDCLGYVVSDTVERDNANYAQSRFIKKKSRAVKPSLSLVLQKTNKKQIFEDYSRNSLLQIKTDKTNANIRPTIKVTVIPRDADRLSAFPDKKTQFSRKSTKEPSNDKDSFATKNIFLIVAGSKKEKIYKVKATDNKTIREKAKDVRTDNKRFPSKMEKKRKKSLSFERKDDQVKCSDANCFCLCPKDDELTLEDEYPTGSSRVRIVGRIGRNEDDKYVMKCAATINGQPVGTNDFPAQTEILSPPKPKKDVHVRRDSKPENVPFQFCVTDDFIDHSDSTSSQATQVGANLQMSRKCSTNDQNTQCNLCELCNNTENISVDDEIKSTHLNRSTSPLVIISVYPKPELKTFAINTMDTSSMNRFDPQTYRPTHINEIVRHGNVGMNTDLYNVRDFTPNNVIIPRCCPCETSNKNDFTKDDTEVTNARTNKRSRSPSPTKRSPSPKTRERKRDFTGNTNTAKPKSRSPSPNRLNKVNQRDANVSKQNKKVSVATKRTGKQHNETPRSKGHDIDTAKEQEHKLTKKMTYNNRNGQHKQVLANNDRSTRLESAVKKYVPKSNISKVSINIDSEREYYDVVFERGNVSTDLIVKRTAKDNNTAQKYFEEAFEKKYETDGKPLSDSLENFFPQPSQHRRSASQTFNNENLEPLTHMSRLNVRDSLEIGHRRDHVTKLSCAFEDGGHCSGPTKHFTGDNCITNPIERDKEIRELLGIEKKKTDKKYTDRTKHKMYGSNTISHRCVIHNTLRKSLTMKPMLEWSYSTYTAKNQKENITNCPYPREEEKSITDDEKQNLKNLDASTRINKRSVDLENEEKCAVVTKQQATQQTSQSILLQTTNKEINPQPHEKQNVILLNRNQYRKIKILIHKIRRDRKKGKHSWNSSILSIGSVKAKRKNEYLIHFNKNIQTDSLSKDIQRSKSKIFKNVEDNNTVVLFCNDKTDHVGEGTKNEMRRVASSVEIRYTSIACSNMGDCSVECSPTRIKNIKYEPNSVWEKRDSIETIFRGHKRTFTPNLGTSSLSLLSEEVRSTAESAPADSKPRKPLLRRLMSCLVMKSETTPLKLPVKQKPLESLNSSVDSYHISTSFAAMDVSSSIYDTSTSFYSNHTIGVVNNKTKRGFFNSVREFLSVKKN